MRVAVVVLGAVAVLASCSGGGKGGAAPTVPPDSTDASGWSKASVAAVHAVAQNVATRLPGGCTDFKMPIRANYMKGLKRVGPPYPDAIADCTALTEDLEIATFPSAAVRDDYVSNRTEKICAVSKEHNIGLPGLYWVVDGHWSIQPDSEGVARRVAQAIKANYKAIGCNGQNPGWDSASVTALQQTAAKLVAKRAGCADFELQDRDLVARTVPYDKIGTPAAAANCTLTDKSTIVLSAYNTPAAKTDQLIRGELGRECVASNTVRIVRAGNVAAFASTPAVADKIKDAIGGSLDPLVCKSLR